MSVSRRAFLQRSGVALLLTALPERAARALAASSPSPGGPGRFLDAHQYVTVRALSGRLVPGPPDDPAPGAIEADVVNYIDALLGAFRSSPPLIYAGGPFSDRAGAPHNDFTTFLALTPLQELSWRTMIEGSRGLREREFNGPVKGLQQLYAEGVSHLDQRSRSIAGRDFVDLPAPAQDALLADSSDSQLQDFLTLAFDHCMEGMYGAPEYGGNRDLVGWRDINFAGDVQPRGYSSSQVSNPDRDASATSPGAGRDVVLRLLTRQEIGRRLSGEPAPSLAPWRGRRGMR